MNASSKYTIEENTKGIFICRSGDNLRNLLNFCKKCHLTDKENIEIKKCSCKSKGIILFKKVKLNLVNYKFFEAEKIRSVSSHIPPCTKPNSSSKKLLTRQDKIEIFGGFV